MHHIAIAVRRLAGTVGDLSRSEDACSTDVLAGPPIESASGGPWHGTRWSHARKSQDDAGRSIDDERCHVGVLWMAACRRLHTLSRCSLPCARRVPCASPDLSLPSPPCALSFLPVLHLPRSLVRWAGWLAGCLHCLRWPVRACPAYRE